MARVTALTMVNRLLRRHGYEDISAFGDPSDLLALDLINQAVRELTSERDYPWNVRNDGELRILGKQESTAGGWNFLSASSAIVSTGFTGTIGDYIGTGNGGSVVARAVVTGAPSFESTAMVVDGLNDAGSLIVTLASDHPGFVSASTDYNYKFIFTEYLLPNDAAKIISVRHQDEPLRLLEIEPYTPFDEVFPRPHDYEDGNPEVVMIGGQAEATYDAGSSATANKRSRLMVWPVPTTTTMLNYSYKERIAEMSATTDVVDAPREFFDDVVNHAEALSNMTQRWNDPALALQQLSSSSRAAERKFRNSTMDPSRRHGLRPHDSGTRRRDPTRYRDIGSL